MSKFLYNQTIFTSLLDIPCSLLDIQEGPMCFPRTTDYRPQAFEINNQQLATSNQTDQVKDLKK